MAAGYLDLLQRELRDAVVHPFPSAGDLAAHAGTEGQIASAEGSFYIFTGGAWRRVANETDISLIQSALARTATSYATVIPLVAAGDGQYPVPHGLLERPVVDVTGPDGAVIDVEVIHDDAARSLFVRWAGTLPAPATVTCVGKPPQSPTPRGR